MADRLLDTDVLIDHLRGARRLDAEGGDFYSVVTRAELFAGRGGDELAVRTALASFAELFVTSPIAEMAGRIRRDARLALPDALIAATALEHGLALATRNRRHFERIPRLRLVK